MYSCSAAAKNAMCGTFFVVDLGGQSKPVIFQVKLLEGSGGGITSFDGSNPNG
jgi:hypothetical protein